MRSKGERVQDRVLRCTAFWGVKSPGEDEKERRKDLGHGSTVILEVYPNYNFGNLGLWVRRAKMYNVGSGISNKRNNAIY